MDEIVDYFVRIKIKKVNVKPTRGKIKIVLDIFYENVAAVLCKLGR